MPVRSVKEAVLLDERNARLRMEALRVYRPMPSQMPFHLSLASERILRGGVRSGKTTAAAAEVASAATGMPLIGCDGTPIKHKYATNRPLLIWCIGYDWEHIGSPIHRLLFEQGVFKIVPDPVTGEWRRWNPTETNLRHLVRPAPPLIPKRMIDPKGWAFENKGRRSFHVCRLKNGTEIRGYASRGEAKQGDAVDLIWIDEDIEYPQHVQEWQSRLADNKGRLIWSALPHSVNDALRTMSRAAGFARGTPHPDVEEWRLRFSDNPFIDAGEKRKMLDRWNREGPHVARVRDDGEFMTDSILMYPNFQRGLHGVREDQPERADDDSKLDAALRQRGGEPPADWTRYLVLDPGHSKPAVLFAAVPPPDEFGEHVVCYDEVYVQRDDAYETARRVREKGGRYAFEAFLIDGKAGHQTPMGFSKRVVQQYQDAFQHEGLYSRLTGAAFIYGSTNVAAGQGLIREWLHIRSDGTPRLKVVVSRCPALCDQFETFKKRDELSDEPAPKQKDDLMACLRYLASYGPQWSDAPDAVPIGNSAFRYVLDRRKRSHREESDVVHMGPAA